MAGEHLSLLPQQDAAALGLLQQGGLHHALQADPLVPGKDLVFDVLGVVGKIIVQPLGRQSGQVGALGQGGVFHLAVSAVRRKQIQRKQGGKKQGKGCEHRVAAQSAQDTGVGMLIHPADTSFIRS